MAFKLGSLPNKNAHISELADFLEVKCLLSPEQFYSITSAKTALGMADDCTPEGIESEEDEILSIFEDALQEIDERNSRCGEKYPFSAERNLIKLKNISKRIVDVYSYLLLATREDMRTKRIHRDIDGALLFEQFCKIIVSSYFGERSRSLVFGTGTYDDSRFNTKVNSLLSALHVSGIYKTPFESLDKQKDGKLDVVAWIPFADERNAKIIAFGQCKTGTEWRTHIGRLSPKGFISSYTTWIPSFTPIKMYFVAESLKEGWEECTNYTEGIFFDRNRLMDYLPNELPNDLYTNMQMWVDSVISSYR